MFQNSYGTLVLAIQHQEVHDQYQLMQVENLTSSTLEEVVEYGITGMMETNGKVSQMSFLHLLMIYLDMETRCELSPIIILKSLSTQLIDQAYENEQ